MVVKILKRDGILKVVNYSKRKGKRVVMLSGSFDLLHAGHIDMLKSARNQGDLLIVLLNSDKSVKAYKGPNRPLVEEKNRAFTLSALTCVDHVFIFNELTPLKWLELFKPDVYCNGGDWGKHFLEHDTVIKNGGQIFIAKIKKNLSTSRIVDNIIKIENSPDIKAIFYFNELLENKLKSYSKKYLIINIKNEKLLTVAESRKIALARSFVISDNLKEIEIGKMHNCKTIFIGNLPKKVSSTEYPDFVIKNISELNKIL